jgi:hypothetical protein
VPRTEKRRFHHLSHARTKAAAAGATQTQAPGAAYHCVKSHMHASRAAIAAPPAHVASADELRAPHPRRRARLLRIEDEHQLFFVTSRAIDSVFWLHPLQLAEALSDGFTPCSSLRRFRTVYAN